MKDKIIRAFEMSKVDSINSRDEVLKLKINLSINAEIKQIVNEGSGN